MLLRRFYCCTVLVFCNRYSISFAECYRYVGEREDCVKGEMFCKIDSVKFIRVMSTTCSVYSSIIILQELTVM